MPKYISAAKQRNVAVDVVMPQPRKILNLARSGAKTALNLAATKRLNLNYLDFKEAQTP